MKKWIVMMLVAIFFVGSFGLALGDDFGPGPAPNSGDGIPDGSGFDPGSQNDSDPTGSENRSPGPAPNSGDGIPDGSGLESPNGPNGH